MAQPTLGFSPCRWYTAAEAVAFIDGNGTSEDMPCYKACRPTKDFVLQAIHFESRSIPNDPSRF